MADGTHHLTQAGGTARTTATTALGATAAGTGGMILGSIAATGMTLGIMIMAGMVTTAGMTLGITTTAGDGHVHTTTTTHTILHTITTMTISTMVAVIPAAQALLVPVTYPIAVMFRALTQQDTAPFRQGEALQPQHLHTTVLHQYAAVQTMVEAHATHAVATALRPASRLHVAAHLPMKAALHPHDQAALPLRMSHPAVNPTAVPAHLPAVHPMAVPAHQAATAVAEAIAAAVSVVAALPTAEADADKRQIAPDIQLKQK